MANKVDPSVLARMRELKSKYGLNNVIIGQRLGLSARTVRAYLNGTQDLPKDTLDVSSSDSRPSTV